MSSAAGRCLQHPIETLGAAVSSVLKVLELLQRRVEEQMGFEQFVFRFVALVRRGGDLDPVRQRLQICHKCMSLEKLNDRDQVSKAVGDSGVVDKDPAVSFSTATHCTLNDPTCIAAGFMAAAFVRCMGDVDLWPSKLLSMICHDLMDLLVGEDPEFRAQIARTLASSTSSHTLMMVWLLIT